MPGPFSSRRGGSPRPIRPSAAWSTTRTRGITVPGPACSASWPGGGRATKMPGASQLAYVEALESQIRLFSADPSAGEARWLLGKLRLATSDRDSAATLWSSIPRLDPRWLDAQARGGRLASGRSRRPAPQQRPDPREAAIRRRPGHSWSRPRSKPATQPNGRRSSLPSPDWNSRWASETRTRHVRSASGSDKSASQAEQRDQANRLHILALGELGRFVEAEREARAEAAHARAADLLEIVRLIDHNASESESDLRLRRFGLILRVLLGASWSGPRTSPRGPRGGPTPDDPGPALQRRRRTRPSVPRHLARDTHHPRRSTDGRPG